MWFIYIVKSPKCEEVYIGSTKRPIHLRFAEHKYCFTHKVKPTTCNRIFEYGEDDVYYELLEEMDTEDKRVLLHRERWWVENTPHVVNHYTPARDREEQLRVYNERQKARVRAKTQPTKCECGYTYYYGRKEKHEQTRRHKSWAKIISTHDS